jgi:hypothetical protein
MSKDLAVIQRAKISISFRLNKGAFAALELPVFYNVRIEGAVDLQDAYAWATQETEASILMYPRHFLEKDGFICVKFLEEIRTKHHQMWGIFGPPKDWGDQRCHLIYASRYADPEYNLQVTDWEIKEWTKKTLLKI